MKPPMAISSDGDPEHRPATCRSAWIRRQRARTNYNRFQLALAATSCPPCPRGDISEDAQTSMPVLELDKLPEDILRHIHSLMPLRDAARVACVSHVFLRSWRSFPNLTFTYDTLGVNTRVGTLNSRAKQVMDRVDHILQNHSGIGVKALKLRVCTCYDILTADHVDFWLQTAVKSGIVDFAVLLPLSQKLKGYNLSCSLLSLAGSSLRSISIMSCGFHPTIRMSYLESLKSLRLESVRITEEELRCLFSSTISLENFEISHCNEITFLNIPSHLQQLSNLEVSACSSLQMVEVYAPKLTKFLFDGLSTMKILIRDSTQLKCMRMDGDFYSNNMIHYARTKVPSIVSNLQTLILSSSYEEFDVPMLPDKLPHLRHLDIYCYTIQFSEYDYFSLASFLEACPALETFVLLAGEYGMLKQDDILQDPNADSPHIRRIPEFRHANLKKVSIDRFSSSKSLIELTYLIIESASSLQCLVLDTTDGFHDDATCKRINTKDVIKARSAAVGAKRYFEGKVPSSVIFKVWEPCSRCHVVKRHKSSRYVVHAGLM